MAGPYVHCMVSREALRNISKDTSFLRYSSITNPDEGAIYFPYVCLGSVSPDYPYPAQKIEYNKFNLPKDKNEWTWGDKFHKQKTGNFIDIGIQALRSEPATSIRTDAFLKKTAWLVGYYSHVITDLVIHAVVYKLVDGCYESHSRDHLICEVTQDSLLFYDVYRNNPHQELVDVKFLKILGKCDGNPGLIDPMAPPEPIFILDPDIKIFWDKIISKNYPDFYKKDIPKIDDWHSNYVGLMKDATTVLARDLSSEAYRRTTEITDENKTRYYSDITLPDETPHQNYKDKVFNKAVDEVTRRLKVFLSAIDNQDSYRALKDSLGKWNLDKGTINGNKPQFALWPPGRTEFPFDCPGDPPQKKV
jgi:Zinc dependent phospholipase C